MPAMSAGGPPAPQRGQTFIEVLFTLTLIVTLVGIAVPLFSDAIDSHRTASAARYVAGRVHLARMEAVKRNTNVGLKFDRVGRDYAYAAYLDTNGNGIRTADIRSGVDTLLMPGERLTDNFAGVTFGLMKDIPDVDGDDSGNDDGVRVGSAKILSLGANGTATSGTLYLHGRRRQFAVRVLGVTGRTRVLYYDPSRREWVSR